MAPPCFRVPPDNVSVTLPPFVSPSKFTSSPQTKFSVKETCHSIFSPLSIIPPHKYHNYRTSELGSPPSKHVLKRKDKTLPVLEKYT